MPGESHYPPLRALALIVAGVLSPAGPVARVSAEGSAKVVDGQLGDWTGVSTMLGGTSQISNGELVYQDYIYDDGGANTGQRSTQRSTTGEGRIDGDFRYPADPERFADNVADLLEVRLAANAETAWLLVRLNALRATDTTVFALAIDTDDNRATGGQAWPFGAGLATPGSDIVVTLRDGGGVVTNLATGATTQLADVAFDVGSNAIEAALPWNLVSGNRWHLHAASGLWNDAAGTWMAIAPGAPTATSPGYGSPTVVARAFNVAFRDDTGPYFEQRQAAALQAGNISVFGLTVELDALDDADVPYVVASGRFYEAIVEESFSVPPLDEGMSFEGVAGRSEGIGGAALQQTFNYFSPHQPYGLYIPTAYNGSPLAGMLVLHGHGGSHAGFNANPAFLQQMGENLGGSPTILVSPLGRGSSSYSDYGEKDVLEVLDDAAARVAIDPERLYIGGYSMGGHGTYRMASLYPDRFAAAVSWAGYTGEFAGKWVTDYDQLTGNPLGLSATIKPITEPIVNLALGNSAEQRGAAPSGNPVQTLENLRYVPLLHLAGTNDQILPVTGQYAAPRRLEQLGYRHRFDLYPGYEHLTFGVVADWRPGRTWLGDTRRTIQPRRITHKMSEAWADPGLPVDLGLVHGRAWWLTGLRQRDDADRVTRFATADLESFAVAGAAPVATTETSPALQPTPHIRRGISWSPGNALPVENRVVATFTNASFAALDLAAAGIDLGRRATIHVTTDGPITVRVLGTDVALGTGFSTIEIVDGDVST